MDTKFRMVNISKTEQLKSKNKIKLMRYSYSEISFQKSHKQKKSKKYGEIRLTQSGNGKFYIIVQFHWYW